MQYSISSMNHLVRSVHPGDELLFMDGSRFLVTDIVRDDSFDLDRLVFCGSFTDASGKTVHQTVLTNLNDSEKDMANFQLHHAQGLYKTGLVLNPAASEITSTPQFPTGTYHTGALKLPSLDIPDEQRKETIETFIPQGDQEYAYSVTVDGKENPVQAAYRHHDLNQVRREMIDARLLALGDDHASGLKLMETMILGEFITMPSDKAREFIALYNEMVNEMPGKFTKLISDFSWKEKFIPKYERLLELIGTIDWIGEDRHMLLIGDLLSDRGLYDGIILAIIDTIRKRAKAKGFHGPVTILASNHDYDFIVSKFHPDRTIDSAQAISHFRMAMIESEDSILETMTRYYDNMDLLHYDVGSKMLFSHGAITKDSIRRLQEAMGFREPITEKNLLDFIEQANTWFRTFTKKLLSAMTTFTNDMTQNKEIVRKNFYPEYEILEMLLSHFLWAGRTEGTPGIDVPHYTNQNIPLSEAGVRGLVHGHDLKDRGTNINGYRIVNLDNIGRKGRSNAQQELVDPTRANLSEPLFAIPKAA